MGELRHRKGNLFAQHHKAKENTTFEPWQHGSRGPTPNLQNILPLQWFGWVSKFRFGILTLALCDLSQVTTPSWMWVSSLVKWGYYWLGKLLWRLEVIYVKSLAKRKCSMRDSHISIALLKDQWWTQLLPCPDATAFIRPNGLLAPTTNTCDYARGLHQPWNSLGASMSLGVGG